MSVAVLTDAVQMRLISGSLVVNDPAPPAPAPAPERLAGTQARAAAATRTARIFFSRVSGQSGQKSGVNSVSDIGSSTLTETITSSASSGSSFQTERTTSGATRTAVPRPHSNTSSPSLNWRVPETTRYSSSWF